MMRREVFITNFFLLLISACSYYLESCDFLIITLANLACELSGIDKIFGTCDYARSQTVL